VPLLIYDSIFLIIILSSFLFGILSFYNALNLVNISSSLESSLLSSQLYNFKMLVFNSFISYFSYFLLKSFNSVFLLLFFLLHLNKFNLSLFKSISFIETFILFLNVLEDRLR
jgi:hypothetical protein